MALGHKTGGRTRGAPNRRTQEAAQILDELGCNPIRGMAEIAMSESHPVELRARMFLELAHYVYPKRKTVDVRVAEPEPREQATSDDVIRWLDEQAERVQVNLASGPILPSSTDRQYSDVESQGSHAGGFLATSVDNLR